MTLPSRWSRLWFSPLLVCFLPGCSGKPDDKIEKPPPAPVKWEAPAQVELSEWIELIGTTQALPNHAARVTAPLEARVSSVLTLPDGKPLSEGAFVKAGKPILVQLDATITQANHDRAEAALNALSEDLQQAQYVEEQAAKRLARLVALKQRDDQRGASGDMGQFRLVTPVEMEEAQTSKLDAESKLRGARLKHEAGKKERDAIAAQLKLYEVASPIDGLVSRVLVTPGQTVTSGTLLLEIVNPGPEIDVLCFVPSSIARRLKIGQEARLGGLEKAASSAALGPKGTVQFIASQGDSDTGSFAVKVRFPNKADAEDYLRANAVIRLRAQTSPGKPCLSVPEEAVLEDQDPPVVLVVENVKTQKDKDGLDEQVGEVRKLQAKIGYRDRAYGRVEIVGLTDPDKKWQGTLDDALFVIEGGLGLQTGDPIKLLVEADEEKPPEEKKPDAKSSEEKKPG